MVEAATYQATAEEALMPGSMTGKTGPELWTERISMAKQATESWWKESGAERFHQEYEGKFNVFLSTKDKDSGNTIPPINDVFAYVQSDISAMNNREPKIAVNPKKTGSVRGAKMLEAWVNYQWRELKTTEELDLELADKDLGGAGFHKVGWRVDSFGDGDNLRILGEGLFSKRIDPRDVFWNVGAERPLKDALWIAHRFTRPLRTVKAKYSAAAKLQGQAAPWTTKDQYQNARFKDDIEVAVLYEVWDSEDRMVYLLADGLPEQFLENPRPWPDWMEEYPIEMYFDFSVPGKPRPLSAIAPWEPQLLEKMVILAQAVNHVKRFNRQAFVSGALNDENLLDKFEQGQDGAILPVEGQGSINDKVKMVDFGTLPTDFYLIMDRLDAVARNVSGQPEIERGGMTKTQTRTLGELQMIKAGAKSRADRRVARLETHMANIARRMIAQFKANFDRTTGQELVRITGELPESVAQAFGDNYDPVTKSLVFTPEDIAGEYDVEVKAGSTMPLDREGRLSLLETALNTLGPIVASGQVTPFIAALIKEILYELGIKSLEDAWDAQVQMQEENQAAEAQTQKIDDAKTAAEMEKRKAQADNIDVDTATKQAELTARVAAGTDAHLMALDGGGPGGA